MFYLLNLKKFCRDSKCINEDSKISTNGCKVHEISKSEEHTSYGELMEINPLFF
jgi:hypothetical protein